MTFAGQQPRHERTPRPSRLLVERAVEIARRTFERNIVIESVIEPDLPPVVCTDGELEQILMNVLLNARDAVVASGRQAPHIRIEACRTRPSAGDGAEERVRIRIEDDGIGMAEDVLARIFDPFFTTKPVGRGTGLGLATSFAIVRELGGTLSCSSTLGRGATFTILLPASHLPVPSSPTSPRESRPTTTLRGSVLLVDDEAPIRRAITMVLEDASFAVTAVASGDEAVRKLEEGLAADIVLLDRSMPGAPGEVFVPKIRSVAPGARIVLFSGRGVEPELAKQVDAVLLKPASAREILAVLEDVRRRA